MSSLDLDYKIIFATNNMTLLGAGNCQESC